MANPIPRRPLRSVELRSHHRSQIPNANLHRRCCRPLRLPGYVVRRPRKPQSCRWIYAGGSEERAYVGYCGVFGGIRVGEKQNVANDADGRGDDDERSADVVPFGGHGDDDGEDRGEGVRRDREELRAGGCVAEIFDDGWLFGELSAIWGSLFE